MMGRPNDDELVCKHVVYDDEQLFYLLDLLHRPRIQIGHLMANHGYTIEHIQHRLLLNRNLRFSHYSNETTKQSIC